MECFLMNKNIDFKILINQQNEVKVLNKNTYESIILFNKKNAEDLIKYLEETYININPYNEIDRCQEFLKGETTELQRIDINSRISLMRDKIIMMDNITKEKFRKKITNDMRTIAKSITRRFLS